MRRRKDSKRQKEGNESEESEYLVQSGEETDGKLAAGDEMKFNEIEARPSTS